MAQDNSSKLIKMQHLLAEMEAHCRQLDRPMLAYLLEMVREELCSDPPPEASLDEGLRRFN